MIGLDYVKAICGEKMPIDKRTNDDRELLETYGRPFDFTDSDAIKPLVEYVSTV